MSRSLGNLGGIQWLVEHDVVELGHVDLLCLRAEANLLHVEANLLGDLLQYLLGEVAIPLAVKETHELDDVSRCYVTSNVPQKPIITIELLHVWEICISNSNDDDAGR